MSAAPALLSTPMTATPPPPRDQGGADAAYAETAGVQFNEALGEVDQRHQPSGDGSEEAALESDAPAAETADLTQTAVSSPVGASLAAALAALGLPWAGPAPSQDRAIDIVASEPAQDPIAALASALAANDAEAVSTASAVAGDMPIEEFIDIHILGRERHLGVTESASQNVSVLNRVDGADAPVDVQEMMDLQDATLPVPVQEQGEAEERPVQPNTLSSARAAPQDASAASTDEPAKSRATGEPGGVVDDRREQGRGTVPGVVAAGRQQETGSNGSGLNGSGAQTGDAPGGPDVALDTTSSRDGQFAQVMLRTAGADEATVDLDGGAGDVSPASQILDQLTAAEARDVISTVKSDGDTRVIELKLKPENLGSVTVRVSLKDDVISLKLEAQRADTALEIGREVDKLANSLKQAGYIVDGISTQQMDPRTLGRIDAASNASSSNSSAQGQAQGSSQGQSFQGGGAGSQQNGQGRASGPAFEGAWASGTNDGQNNGLASERQTGLYV